MQHLKVHTLVCKKKASKLDIDPNRQSFVISLISDLPDCMCNSSARLNSGARSVVSNGKLPRNIHGDNEFFIKIQTPLHGKYAIMFLVYFNISQHFINYMLFFFFAGSFIAFELLLLILLLFSSRSF